jgi:hypothetical protein
MIRNITLVLTLLLSQSVVAQLVINELMPKNVSFVMDESKNYSMWVEVYNKGAVTENLGDYCFTDNSSDLEKWRPQNRPVPAGGFAVLWFERPDFQGHANFKLDPEGGMLFLTKNGAIIDRILYSVSYRNVSYGRTIDGAGEWTRFIEPSVYRGEEIAEPIAAINNNDSWNYWYKTTPPTNDWNTLNFNDSDWEQNKPAPLGYGKVVNTVIGSPRNPPVQTGYFRKKINITDVSKIFACKIDAMIDDAAIFYVNGTEVYRDNLPSGEITYYDGAITAYGNPSAISFNVPANLLVEGENIIAAEVHQSADLNSSDYYFSLTFTHNNQAGNMQNPYSNVGRKIPEGICTVPEFETPAGFYSAGALNVTFKQQSAGRKIHYTTDGSEPTENSPEYEADKPIILMKTTCVRAATFAENRITSNIATATYFIGERNFNLPVVSFATDPKNFFDSQIGIYTDGVSGKKNYEQDWDRPVNFELFDTLGVTCLNQELDVSTAGAYSKAHPLKSLKISPKAKFGDKRLRYDIFSSKRGIKLKDIQIRNSGNDFDYTMFRDGFMQTLIINRLDIDYQAYEPAICFINGVYYGIENLRERTNKDYLYANYGLDEDEFILIERDNYQSCTEYMTLLNFLNSGYNFSVPANYKEVEKMLDVNSYIDYIIAQTYYSNYDWPDNNYKMWRPVESGGKWRWLLYDLDFGFGLIYDSRPGGYAQNTIQHLFNSGENIIVPLRKLIENETFKNTYINRFCVQLSTTFDHARVDAIMDSLVARIEDEIPYHKNRWSSVHDFYNEINIMKTFSHNRADYLMNYLSQYFFQNKPIINISLSSNSDNVRFVFNSENVPENPAVIRYFKDNQVKITATSAEGKTFSHWELQSSNGIQAITSAEFSATLSENIQLKAIFDSTNGIENILPNNAKTVKSIDYFDVLGRKLPKNAKGIVIKKIIYEDNTSSTEKTFLK